MLENLHFLEQFDSKGIVEKVKENELSFEEIEIKLVDAISQAAVNIKPEYQPQLIKELSKTV